MNRPKTAVQVKAKLSSLNARSGATYDDDERAADQAKETVNIEEHKRLSDKLRLLDQDRRVYYDTVDAEIKRNRDEIRDLRAENKNFKSMIMDGRKGDGNVLGRELRQLDDCIYQTTLKMDSIKEQILGRQAKLSQQESIFVDIEKDSEPVLTEESFLTKKISLLENRLDKSLIKYNEAVSIKKTYEGIVRRLSEERCGFDNQLQAIERTLAAKEHDYQELLKMSHQANHAKELAKKELHDFKSSFDDSRKQKDRELADRKGYVQTRVDQTQKLERREKSLKQKEQDDARHRSEEDVTLSRGKSSHQFLASRSNTEVLSEEDQRRLSTYDTAFKTIRDATGITEVDDLLRKYLSQEETHQNLEHLARECQSRIDQLTVEKNDLKNKLDELRYSGSGHLGSRRIVEEFEIHLAECEHQSQRNAHTYEDTMKLMVRVKAGIEHLLEKLSHYRHDVQAPPLPIADDNAIDAMKVVEAKLMSLADDVVPSTAGTVGTHDTLAATAFSDLPAHNRRVKLVHPDDEDAEDEFGNEAGDLDVGDDAVLKRDQVKKISVNAIHREAKKQKRKKK